MKINYNIQNKYGDMSDSKSVKLPTISSIKFPDEERPLFIHLTMTMQCNGRCKGCINSCITNKDSDFNLDSLTTDPIRDAKAIINLAERENISDVVVCLYGGEPLLASDKIEQLMNELSKNENINYRYMLYTNGLFIEQSLKKYDKIKKNIWLYSISIDGKKEQHESVRIGISYDRIKQNLEYLKSINSSKEILMWSTLREEQSLKDCFESFLSLLDEGLVNHWFWHFVETQEEFNDLTKFGLEYEQDLRYIMDIYLEYLKKGKILSIIHINELILYILSAKKRNTSACGVELATNFDIVGGKIQVCSDLPPEYNIGYISDDGNVNITNDKLSKLMDYKKGLNCQNCGIHSYCGGRCPIQAISGTKRLKQYCQLLRIHVAVVMEYIDKIEKVMKENNVTVQKIYTKSAKFAQFTDVTP